MRPCVRGDLASKGLLDVVISDGGRGGQGVFDLFLRGLLQEGDAVGVFSG